MDVIIIKLTQISDKQINFSKICDNEQILEKD